MENSVDTQPLTSRARGSSGETIDVERLIAAFRRRLWLFVAVAGVIAAVLMFVMLRQTPMYTATANVMINTRTEKVVDSQAVLSGLTADTGTVDTEVEVIKSPQLAETVVDALKLDKDPEFNAALKSPGLIGSVLGGKKAAAERAAPGAAEAERQAVIAAVGKRLTVRRVGLTYSITISFESTSAIKSATIANAFADAYLRSQLTAKFDATRQANSFLNTRLDTLRTQLQEADAAVSNYRVANNLLSSEGTTLTEQEISAYNQQLAQARAQQAEDEARLRTARAQLAAGSNGDDVGEALSSQVVQNLRAQRRWSAAAWPRCRAATANATQTWCGPSANWPTSTSRSRPKSAASSPTWRPASASRSSAPLRCRPASAAPAAPWPPTARPRSI